MESIASAYPVGGAWPFREAPSVPPGAPASDPPTAAGRRVRWTPGESPSARMKPGMTFDSTRHQVMLFGGFDGALELGDTWIWSGITWTCVAGCG